MLMPHCRLHRQFEKILNGVSVEDIVIYPDKCFLTRSTDGRITVYGDTQILVADEIYRLNEIIYCVSSQWYLLYNN